MAFVTVRSMSAWSLIQTDRDGSDPFVVVSIGRQTFKTRYVRNSSDPEWDEEFTFDSPKSVWLRVAVFDYDGPSNDADALGQSSVDLAALGPGTHDVSVPLRGDGVLSMQVEVGDDGKEEGELAEDLGPTDMELADLSLACQRLWDLDSGRLNFGEHFALNLQAGVAAGSSQDSAADPLFSFIDEGLFEIPTFRALKALLDNYEADTGVEERASDQEMGEIHAFLDAILATPPMQYAWQYLAAKGKVGRSQAAFKRVLYSLWFDMYGRQGRKDSCGFEHVFCGEEKKGAITGFHNWVKFALEEQAGRMDYRGFIYSRRRGQQSETDDPTPNLITIKFAWQDDEDEDDADIPVKTMSSIFIGVSPEFEMALYTLCFLAGGTDNMVHVGEYRVNVKCYPMNRYGRTYIGTAYPQAQGWDGDE
mmetsp:Transcript_61511/g.109642  ORF Transcript_61511/g.109642 Transcript_61511/m.109642 type:complete len:420 (-) Transcript_61511:22-1281(-)